MHHMTVAISGMSCQDCVRAVREALEAVPGAQVDAVTIGSATVSYDEQRTPRATLVDAIERAGFQPTFSGVPISPIVEDPIHCERHADGASSHDPRARP